MKNFHSRNRPVNWALGPCWRCSSWLFWILMCLKSNLYAFVNILAFLYCQGSVAETQVYDFFEKSSPIKKLLRDSFLRGVKGAMSIFVKNNCASWYFASIKVPTEGRKYMFLVASCTRTLPTVWNSVKKLEKVKSIVLEKQDFEYRDDSKLLANSCSLQFYESGRESHTGSFLFISPSRLDSCILNSGCRTSSC